MTSSINIFFSIPPSPNLSFLHLSFFELSHPTFNLSSFHNLSYPISSFLLSDSASTHLQLLSSLTSNSVLIPTTHPNPHFLSQHNQSSPTSTQVPSPLHFHVFLSINHPMRLPVTLFLSLPPTQHLHLSLTSHPPLLPFQFSLHLLRHRLSGSFSNLHAEIHRAGCLWHARGTTIPRRSAVKTMPRDNRDHYAASSTSTRNYHSYLNPSPVGSRLLLLLVEISPACYSWWNVDLVKRRKRFEGKAATRGWKVWREVRCDANSVE